MTAPPVDPSAEADPLAAAGPLTPDNPLAVPSDLPYGLPDFASIRSEHLAPALAAGLAEQRREWRAIAETSEAPTAENTLAALERSGRLLRRATGVVRALVAAGPDERLLALDAALGPALARHRDALHLDPVIRTRLDALYAAHLAGEPALDPETAWLLHVRRTAFARAGARLGDDERTRLRDLNAEIAELETTFSQAVVAASAAGAVAVEDAAELTGVPEDMRAALAHAAEDRGREGHLVTLRLSTGQPILAFAANRDLRRRVLEASLTRGGGVVDPRTDTRDTVVRLARLRHERARLLGYPHHAAYVAEDGTAGSAAAVLDLLRRLAPPARRNAEAEAEELRTVLREDVPGATLEPWDWAYYAQRVRRERDDLDDGDLRPFLDADRVLRDGVLFAAERLYGLAFTDRPDLRGHAEGSRVLEVREEDGVAVGLCLIDLYARPGKRGGAWMDSLSVASRLLGDPPVVTVNLNVDRPADGEPTLLTWDETITLFHEFGHALHGLLSDVHYPSVSGTAVPRDVVEYPSQVNEMWATDPEVLARFARHHLTGAALPAGTAEWLRTSRQEGGGFRTLEYLQAALLDQAWHRAGEGLPTTAEGVAAFESDALDAAGVAFAPVPPRYRSTYFAHAFGGGYDAAYYSYVWSEVLDADTVDWFGENGGLDRAAGQRFRATVLSRGHSRDPQESFRALRGRDPVVEPLLRRRGLPAHDGAPADR